MSKILGLQDINRALISLPGKMQSNVLGAGNRAVAKAVAEQMQADEEVPLPIRAAITFRANRKKRVTKGFLVGLRKPRSALAHLFEFGTGLRFQKKTGRYTGRMKPTPFMRVAVAILGAEQAERIWARAAERNFKLQLKRVNRL